jgi:exopolysaccharide production protein ExoZ
MGRLQSLQALRFFAALAVVLDHAALKVLAQTGRFQWRGVPMDLGSLGVHVFFVISGFIMVRAVLSRPVSAVQFWFDRWWRVAPIYLLATLAIGLLVPGVVTPDRIAATLTFWPVWHGKVTDPVLFVGWSLCFEMLFYACLGLSRLHRLVAPVLLVGFVACWAAAGPTHIAALRFLGNPVIVAFLAGIAIAKLWKGERRPVLGGALIICAAVWFAVVLALGRPDMGGGIGLPLPRTLIFTALAVAIVYGVLQFEMKAGVLPYLGDASYALYLVHPTVLWLLRPLLAFWPGFALAGVLLSILAAAIVHQWIEKPIARWKPNLPSPLRTGEAGAAA